MTRTPQHERLRQLVLSWEDLTVEERQDAESHLESCADCRALHAAFERHERTLGPLGSFPESAFEASVALPEGERASAEASRGALLERLGAGAARSAAAPGARVPARRRASLAWWWVPAVAAAAVAIAWLVRPVPTPDDVLRELEVVPLHVVRGHADSGRAGAAGWRSGDEFELRVRLARPAWPVVVHVSPDGGVTLLRPAARELDPVPAGVQRLGPLDPEEAWVIQGGAATEVLFVAADDARPVLRDRLLRDLESLGARADHEVRVSQVQRLLERRFGGARRVDIAHD